jgi:hypothetical protein
MHISKRKYYRKHVFIGSRHLIFETATRWTETMTRQGSGGQSVERGLALGVVVVWKP